MSEQHATGIRRHAPDPSRTGSVVAAANALAADLYPLATEDTEDTDNLAFSPLSIAVALAMVGEGARGTSRRQIQHAAHLGDVADVHGGWSAVHEVLTSRPGVVTHDRGSDTDVILNLTTRLWIEADLQVQEAFRAVLAVHYDTDVTAIDFAADPGAARTVINAWVADQTDGRIPELVAPEVIDATTAFVLTNAVHFKAPWAHPFPTAGTADGTFTRLDGSTVQVPSMRTTGRFATLQGDGFLATELAYAGEHLEMVLIVPDPGRFDDIESRVGVGLVDQVPAGLPGDDRSLTMPSFRIRCPIRLDRHLATLGMPDPFRAGVADFSGITAQEELSLQAVIHEAFVAVDEVGTEAAAATAVAVARGAAGPPPVAVDRPFVWAIRDVSTGAILFLGRVLDPSIKA